MRIVIVTGEQLHQEQLCVGLTSKHEVVGIIHPCEPTSSKWRRMRARARNYGWLYSAMALATAMPSQISGWNSKREMQGEAERRFGETMTAYEKLPGAIFHRNVDINVAGPHLLSKLRPDVVVVLGGPVYRAAFIEAAPLILNFHSGVSPIYNGTASINFAFANGHPHLCGGTLMTMNTIVDGGSILGHFLPQIESGDTPASLFMKTVAGATIVYDRILEHLACHATFSSVPQPSPLFYYRGLNWTLYQSLITRRHVSQDIASKHVRPEEVAEYWKESDDAEASASFDATIDRLLARSSR